MNKVSITMKKRIQALKGSPERESLIASPTQQVAPTQIKALLDQSIQIEHLGTALV